MTNPTIQIGDEVREMSATEYAQHKKDTAAELIIADEIAAQAAAKKSAHTKLAALGLTADEIAAL